jgi:ElaB/YqjD/DUF883 family membrane-anchored ribosome-binding protein
VAGEPARKSKQRESTMTEHTEEGRDRLVDDMSAVLSEAEEMLKRAATETGEKARDLRSQVETNLLRAKLKLQEYEGQAIDHAKAAARYTDDYVHDNPWRAIGVAAAIGLLIGLLMNRR